MNIEFLDTVLSATFSLRKLKKIEVQQRNEVWKPRSNIHCMIVMPFGHQKSTLTKKMENGDSYYKCDTFTEAGFKGSISQNGDVIPPILKNFGSKVVFIDEWNSVNYFAQLALLSVMENQEFTRALGFSYRGEWEHRDPHMHLTIRENEIKGHYCYFSLVAFAMSFPRSNKTQGNLALLSRFMPVFIESSDEMVASMMTGDWKVNVNDASNNIDKVKVTLEVFEEFTELITQAIKKEQLFSIDPDENGFIMRGQADVLRLGIANHYIENKELYSKIKPSKKKQNVIVIDTIEPFKKAVEWFGTIINQYRNPQTKGKIEQFTKLVQLYPDESSAFYSRKLGVTVRQIDRYRAQTFTDGLMD